MPTLCTTQEKERVSKLIGPLLISQNGVGVGVIVGVGVKVAVGVSVAVGVIVGVGDNVLVGVKVAVKVGVGGGGVYVSVGGPGVQVLVGIGGGGVPSISMSLRIVRRDSESIMEALEPIQEGNEIRARSL
jgi:hypothetical protein